MSLPIKSDSLEVVSGGAANPSVTSGTADPTLGLSRPEGSIFLRYVVAGGQAFIKFGAADTDWDVLATGGGGIGGSLDDAYDFGGPGLGRTITADSGALQLDSFTTNSQAALVINRQPAGSAAAVGIDLSLNGNLNASGVGIQITDAGAGTSLKVTKSNAGSVYFADLTNAGAKALEVVVTAAPTSVSPVSIVANTTGTTAALLSISKIPGASTAGNGISVSMGANTTGAGIVSTNAGPGAAVAAINSSASAGAMSIQNTNVAGPVDFYATDSAGTAQMSWGYGNASYSDAARANRGYVWRNAGKDFVFARTGVVDAILKSDGKLGIGTATTLTAQLEVNGTTPDIFINGSTSGFLRYPTVGVQAPTFTTRSLGTKVVLYPAISGSAVDYALGIEGGTLWYSVEQGTSAFSHKWYAGTTERMRLRGDGVLRITQSLADPLDGTGAITLQNTLSTSLAQITWLDHTGAFQAALGSSNPSAQGQIYWYFDSPTSAGLLFSGPGGTNMNIFAGVANGAGFQMHSGSAVVVSDANTGRMRYVTAGQKFQFSLNGGAYVDVPTLAAAFTAGSVPFANATGQLAQNNPMFFWDNTQHALLLYTDSAGSANGPLFVRSTVTTGPGAMGALDIAGAFKSYWGHYNSAYAFTYMRNKNGILTDGSNIIFGNLTVPTHEFGMTAASVFFEMFNGGSAAVSSANAGRIRYNTTGQKFQVSMNGAAYVDLQTGADFTLDIGDAVGSSTVGSVLFVGAGNVLQQDNANLFWDDTNNVMGIGTASPDNGRRLHLSSTATGAPLAIETTNASGAAVAVFKLSGAVKGGVGYGTATTATVAGQNRSYLHGSDVDAAIIVDAGASSRVAVFASLASVAVGINNVAPGCSLDVGVVGGTTTAVAVRGGSTAAVSAASTGRLRYNESSQKFQVSTNGGAYTDLAVTAPTVERLSADGAADPAIDTTFVSGTGTDLTLANGTADGFIKNFVVTGGTGTITPANLADGDVLTWSATPANVSFIWDATGTTWHVYGNPYNMVTT